MCAGKGKGTVRERGGRGDVGWVRLGAGGGKRVSRMHQGRSEGSGASLNIPVACVCVVCCALCVCVGEESTSQLRASRQSDRRWWILAPATNQHLPRTQVTGRAGRRPCARGGVCVRGWERRDGGWRRGGDSCDLFKVVAIRLKLLRLA